MRVAVLTSVSSRIADMAALTTPNKLEYCLRHGYTLIVDNMPYSEAVVKTGRLCAYLDSFDFLWCLDCDAIVTNMLQPIHSLECLGPHVTVCEEGIVDWNWINCGSMVWRNTSRSRQLLRDIESSHDKWQSLPCQWQTWLGELAKRSPELLTVAHLRAFNSCVWSHPGGGEHAPGGHWQRGDFVYHPCGVFPLESRPKLLEKTLQEVVR